MDATSQIDNLYKVDTTDKMRNAKKLSSAINYWMVILLMTLMGRRS